MNDWQIVNSVLGTEGVNNNNYFYHVSADDSLTEMTPHIPRNEMVDKGFENGTIKRICVCENIDDCLAATSEAAVKYFKKYDHGELYVYVIDKSQLTKKDYMMWNEIKKKKYVFDIDYTHECWVFKKIKVKRYAAIKLLSYKKKETVTFTNPDTKEEMNAPFYNWTYKFLHYWDDQIYSTEGLGPETTLKKYAKTLDNLITTAWKSHVNTWNNMIKCKFINTLQNIDPSHIMIPLKQLDKKAEPNKKLFYKKMWVDINKLAKLHETDTLPTVRDNFFVQFFVKGFKDKEQANLHTQAKILGGLKKFIFNKKLTFIETEIAWHQEGLKVKLRLETKFQLPKEMLDAMQKTYVNNKKIPD